MSDNNDGDAIDEDCSGDISRFPGTSLGYGDIVVSEIMRNPNAVSDTVGEYIEIYNNTDRYLDLNELYLEPNAAITGSVLSLNTSGFIGSCQPVGGGYALNESDRAACWAPGTYLVIADSNVFANNGGISTDSDSDTFSDAIAALFTWEIDNVGAASFSIYTEIGGDLLDEVTFSTGTPWPSGAAQTGASIVSTSLDADLNDVATDWVVATSTYGAGDKGTPGASGN